MNTSPGLPPTIAPMSTAAPPTIIIASFWPRPALQPDREWSARHRGQRGNARGLEHDSSLIRGVGTWGLAAAIVNGTIGAGIFRLPASVAASLGAAAPAAYLICAIAMGLIVLC